MNIIQKPSPNHYRGRDGHAVDRITLHIMAGYQAGTDAIFANAAYQASSTYSVGGDGAIHQHVSEADGAWADGSYESNCRTISIEHQGGLDFIPCTRACLDASAALCADIARRRGWGRLAHGVNVFLHREVPPYTHPDCPDRCPNGLDWAYIINKANQLLDGLPSGEEQSMATPAENWSYTYNKSNTTFNMLADAASNAIALNARPTHVVFQNGGSLGIANLVSGTYEMFVGENQMRVRLLVLQRAGYRVREWRDYNAARSNIVKDGDLPGFGVRIRQEETK